MVQKAATMTSENEAQSTWKINKDLLPLKGFNFLLYGACIVIPFMTVLLKQLNLNASEIGIITGCPVFLCMFTRPTIGMVVDKLGGQKTALVLCCMGFGLSFFALSFIPGRSIINNHTTKLNNTEEFNIWMCPLQIPSNSTNHHVNTKLNQSSCYSSESLGHNIQQTYDENTFTFHFLCPISPPISSKCSLLVVNNTYSTELFLYQVGFPHSGTGIRRGQNNTLMTNSLIQNKSSEIPSCLQYCPEVFQSSAIRLEGDSLAIRMPGDIYQDGGGSVFSHIKADSVFLLALTFMISARILYSSSTSLADTVAYSLLGPNPHRWARQRLWGTLGTGLFAIVTTTISNIFQQGNDLSAMFYACLCLTFLACVLVIFKLKAKRTPKNANLGRDLHTVLATLVFRFLLCKLFLFGFMAGTAQNFFMWFVSDIGGTRLNLGLMVVSNCVSSLCLLRFTGRVLKKIGQQRVMYMALIAYAVRFLAISFLWVPWAALPIELLHGVTYSMFWAAASGATSRVAPSGTQATCQGIAGAVYWDLGRGIGTMTSGQLIQVIGARWTFRTYAAACVVVLPLMYAVDRTWAVPEMRADDTNGHGDNESRDTLMSPEAVTPQTAHAALKSHSQTPIGTNDIVLDISQYSITKDNEKQYEPSSVLSPQSELGTKTIADIEQQQKIKT